MNPYTTNDNSLSIMMGRKRLFKKVNNRLKKSTPDNISIVGPKRFGKTVFLNSIAKNFQSPESIFSVTCYVDLRHGTPSTDSQFLLLVSSALKNSLNIIDKETAGLLSAKSEDEVIVGLETFLDYYSEENKKALLIFDGFDHLPLGNGISPNLLGQLRTFAQRRSLRLLISSRKRLRDICKTEAARSSDFWRIFEDPIFMGCFEEDDLDDLLKPFTDSSCLIDPGVKKELMNWTGGIPILMSLILKTLFENKNLIKSLMVSQVNEICSGLTNNPNDIIADLWEDLDTRTQNILVDSIGRQLKESDIPYEVLIDLKLRGIAQIEKGHLKINRSFNEYIKLNSSFVQDLSRLFRTEESYNENIKRVLELHLDQYQSIDDQFKKDIHRAIRDLSEDPRHSLDSARGIVEDCISIIGKVEESEKNATESWKKEWDNYQLYLQNRGLNRTRAYFADPVPTERGKQVELIRYISGRVDGYSRVAKCVSRQTSVLLEQINTFGNLANHLGGEVLYYGIASSMCFLAIELYISLAKDISALSSKESLKELDHD